MPPSSFLKQRAEISERNQQYLSISAAQPDEQNPADSTKMSRAVHKLILSPSQNAVFSSPKRWFAAKSKKGGKGGGAAATKAGPNLSREEISKTVVAANINKEGSDPAIKPDSEYPDWLWRLVEKEPPLSVLQRKDPSTMSFYELSRFVKLENRRRIKEKNSLRAKN